MARAKAGEEPIEGDLEPGVLPRVLSRLYRQGRTGLFHLTRGPDRSTLCFVRGEIAWGHTSVTECQLGPVLLLHALLSPEALDQASDLMGRGKRLGELLMELGGLDRETLDEGLALQVREMLFTAFAWPDGAWRFEDQPVEFFRGYDRTLAISTGDLILDAAWCVSDPDVVRYHLGDLGRRLAFGAELATRLQGLTLGATDHLLLSCVNGVRPAREVMDRAGVHALEAQRSLFGLLCAGLLDLLEPEAPAEPNGGDAPPTREEILRVHRILPTADHFEVLGLLHNAAAHEVGRAAGRLVMRFTRAFQDDPSLSALQPQIDAILARVLEAARILGNPSRRDAYDRAVAVAEVKARLLAAPPSPEVAAPAPSAAESPVFLVPLDLLAEAEAEFAEGRYWDALQAVDVLIGELTGRMRLRARLLRARVHAKNPAWRKEAEEELKEVVAADPAHAEAYFLLGQIYDDAGLASRAEAMFRKVLSLRPRHAGARARLVAGED